MRSARTAVVFGLAGLAIALRLASDWVFPRGGPLEYQLAQALLLVIAIGVLGSDRDQIFLRGGSPRPGLREIAIAIPLAFAGGLALAYARFGGPQWPTWNRAAVIVGNNLFFPAVEEVEFRAFLLAWVLRVTGRARLSIWLVAAVHTLAHAHWLFDRNAVMLATSFALFAWYGSLTLRTRSIWPAIAAHAAVNIFGFLPTTGGGARTP